MTIKLEVGKKYRNLNSDVFEVGKCYLQNKYFLKGEDGCVYCIDDDLNFDTFKQLDLIEEVIEEPVKKPHKYAELIKAWADGISLQKRYPLAAYVAEHRANWHDFEDGFYPNWEADWIEYRIKPEPKPDVVSMYCLGLTNCKAGFTVGPNATPNLKVTWDGTTGKLKGAEVL